VKIISNTKAISYKAKMGSKKLDSFFGKLSEQEKEKEENKEKEK